MQSALSFWHLSHHFTLHYSLNSTLSRISSLGMAWPHSFRRRRRQRGRVTHSLSRWLGTRLSEQGSGGRCKVDCRGRAGLNIAFSSRRFLVAASDDRGDFLVDAGGETWKRKLIKIKFSRLFIIKSSKYLLERIYGELRDKTKSFWVTLSWLSSLWQNRVSLIKSAEILEANSLWKPLQSVPYWCAF